MPLFSKAFSLTLSSSLRAGFSGDDACKACRILADATAGVKAQKGMDSEGCKPKVSFLMPPPTQCSISQACVCVCVCVCASGRSRKGPAKAVRTRGSKLAACVLQSEEVTAPPFSSFLDYSKINEE